MCALSAPAHQPSSNLDPHLARPRPAEAACETARLDEQGLDEQHDEAVREGETVIIRRRDGLTLHVSRKGDKP